MNIKLRHRRLARELSRKQISQNAWALRLRTSAPDYFDLRERSETLEQIALYDRTVRNISGLGEPERIPVALVSGEFFDVLGVTAHLGRTFSKDEDLPGSQRLLMISHEFWVERFGSNPDALGKILRVNDRPHTIVGVLPPGFQLWGFSVNQFEVWTLARMDPNSPRRNTLFRAVARLREGVELAVARAELSAIADDLERAFPVSNEGVTFRLEPLHDEVVRDVDVDLGVLQGFVVLVLLIICANVGDILMAHSSARTQEIAIRNALGAGRGRIFQQILIENLGLIVAGSLLGLGLAYLGVDFLVRLLPPLLPGRGEIGIDGWVLTYTVTSTILVALLVSITPACIAFSSNLAELAKDGVGSSMSRRKTLVLRGLVVSEIALSLVLLVGAGLSAKSLLRLSQVDTGFETANRGTFELALAGERYQDEGRVRMFFETLQTELGRIPGVESVGSVRFLPLGSSWGSMPVFLEGVGSPDEANANAIVNTVGGDYFETMGVDFLRGRWLGPLDHSSARPRVVISERMARLYGEDSKVLGQRLRIQGRQESLEVVGVVADVSLRGLATSPDPIVYRAERQFPVRRTNLVIKTESQASLRHSDIREALVRIDPDIPLANFQDLTSLRSEAMSGSLLIALFTSLFALTATLLALLGLYVMISYMSVRRSHEIGIRMAIGANQNAVFRLVLGAGMSLILSGIGLGLLIAAGLSRLMSALLFEVSPLDLTTFLGVAGLFLGVALLACAIPARQTMRLDPLQVLRSG